MSKPPRVFLIVLILVLCSVLVNTFLLLAIMQQHAN